MCSEGYSSCLVCTNYYLSTCIHKLIYLYRYGSSLSSFYVQSVEYFYCCFMARSQIKVTRSNIKLTLHIMNKTTFNDDDLKLGLETVILFKVFLHIPWVFGSSLDLDPV